MSGHLATALFAACCRYGFLESMSGATRSFVDICEGLNANRRYLRAALSCFTALGWLRHDPEADAFHFPAGLRPHALAHAAELLQEALCRVNECFEQSAQGWHVMDADIADVLDGVLIVELSRAALRRDSEGGLSVHGLSGTAEHELQELLVAKQLCVNRSQRLEFSTAGRSLQAVLENRAGWQAQRAVIGHVEALLLGDTERATRCIAHECEMAVLDLAVRGTRDSQAWLVEMETALEAIFDAEPLDRQPHVVVAAGCESEVVLARVASLIRHDTVRGRHLSQYPLRLIAVTVGAASSWRHQNELSGMSSSALDVATDDPACLVPLLQEAGISNAEDVLYLNVLPGVGRVERLPATTTPPAPVQARGASAHMTPEHCAAFERMVHDCQRWGQVMSRHGLLQLATHEAVSVHCQPHAKDFVELVLSTPLPAERWLTAAATAGWFARRERARRWPQRGPCPQATFNHFEKRDYVVRYSDEDDIAALLRLEAACWAPELRTSQEVIGARVAQYPDGQLVLERAGRVVGVIYSQRIASRDELAGTSSSTVHRLHRTDGPVLQLLAVNIDPDMQDAQLGDQLLEFMLQRAALLTGVEAVVAVTRCKDYVRTRHGELHTYIHARNARGQLIDTILRFHEQHGASILGLVVDYRPLDAVNAGAGVLVGYDIHDRPSAPMHEAWPDRYIQIEAEHDIQAVVLESVSRRVKLGAASMRTDQPFLDLGLDSADLLEIREEIGAALQSELGPMLFFEYNTCDKLIAALSRQRVGKPPPHASVEQRDWPQGQDVHRSRTEVAIVGMSGRFPGGEDLEQFWRNLTQGRDCITPIPPERWNHSEFYEAQRHLAGKTDCALGGFLDAVEQFDPLFFGIAPQVAADMDPQERLLLEVVWNLLESNNYTRDRVLQTSGGNVAVYVGAMSQQYEAIKASLRGAAFGAAVSSFSALANRISSFFDLAGPSVALDTMCSSGAIAIHLACEDVRRGECRMAIAAGVNLLLHPSRYVGLSAMNLLGNATSSRSLNKGSGYLPAEGVGAVLLKPLEAAIRDGDRILGVLKSSTTTHVGRGSGYFVPDMESQVALMRRTLHEAQVAPESVSYVEVSASGSALADEIEVAALTKVFGKRVAGAATCTIGSVKTNIGHAEAASAFSQLAKVLLQLQHAQIPASIAVEAANEAALLGETPFRLQRTLGAWTRCLQGEEREAPRRALINCFGAGGSNVSMVIEEWPSLPAIPAEALPEVEASPQVIVCSAKSIEGLRAYLQQLRAQLAQASSACLRDLAYTLQVGREAMEVRWASIVDSVSALAHSIDGFLGNEPTEAQAPAYFPTGKTWICDSSQLEGTSPPLRKSIAPASMRALIDTDSLDEIARLWVHGTQIPWEWLHSTAAPKRIALPTHPFVKRRCWIGVDAAPLRPTDSSIGIVEQLHRCLQYLLGVASAELQPNRSLAQIGLDSIATLKLQHLLANATAIPIDLRLLDPSQTLRSLEQRLARLVQDELPQVSITAKQQDTAQPACIARQSEQRHESFPLTDMQESFLVGRQLGTQASRVGAHLYFETHLTRIDPKRLGTAWNQLIQHHDMLRAVFTAEGQQRVLPQVPFFRVRAIDLRWVGEAEQFRRLQDTRERMSTRLYDPTCWPLFDIAVSICPGYAVLHFSIDELIADGMSLFLLVRQWQELYAEPEMQLPSLTLSFRDWVVARTSAAAVAQRLQDLDYWMRRLEHLPPLSGIAESAPQVDTHTRRRLHTVIDAPRWHRLQDFARACSVSPTVLLLTLFVEVLSTWFEQASCATILTLFNRLPADPEIDAVVGPFVSSSVFMVPADAPNRLEDLLGFNQSNLWSDLNHTSVGGVTVLRTLKARGLLPRAASLPIVFTSFLHNVTLRGPVAGGESFDQFNYFVNQTPQVYLDHQVLERDDRLELSWDVAPEYFGATSVAALFDAYRQTLEAVADGRTTLEDLQCLVTRARDRCTSCNANPSTPSRVSQEGMSLTELQRAYLFGRTLQGGAGSCQFYQEIDAEELDLPRLNRAWQVMVRRHEALRTMITEGTQRVIDTEPDYRPEVVDLREQSIDTRSAGLVRLRQEMIERDFDLRRWPYFDVRVALLDERRARIHVAIDMIIADGASIVRLLNDFLRTYQTPPRQPAVSAGSLRALHERAMGGAEYWDRKFQQLPRGPQLRPSANPTRGGGDGRALRHHFAEWRQLQQLAARRRLSPMSVLVAAYIDVLTEIVVAEPFTIVVPCWQRPPSSLEVGEYTALAWVGSVGASVCFAERARRIGATLEADLAHAHANPLAALRKRLPWGDGWSGFPVVFTQPLPPIDAFNLPPGFVLRDVRTKTANVVLDCVSVEREGGLDIHWHVADHRELAVDLQGVLEDYGRILHDLSTDESLWGDAERDSRQAAQADSLSWSAVVEESDAQ